METTGGSDPSSANAKAYEFDSQATPQQKAQAMLHEAPAQLKTERRNRATEIVSDVRSNPAVDMPRPLSREAAAHDQKLVIERATGHEVESTKIGWEMAGGSSREEYARFIKEEEDPALALPLTGRSDHRGADHLTALEAQLPEGTFGDWYHNAGIIIFCALSCWIVGRFGGGLAWIILLLSICATYYRTSIRRFRRNVRDDTSRQMAKAKLETDYESAEWMNSFLTKFWIIYEPILSATIVSSVDQVLATTTPAFLDSMRLAFFTLGTKAPRIEHVKTYPRSEDDIVLMDWRFSFTPNDVDDLTTRQIKNKINPKIELAIKAGVSVASVNIPVVVEDIAFSGIMQVRIKLMTEYPNIKLVDLSFLEKPEIGYVLKPIGGSSLGFDIGFIPGLSGWILEMIHASLAPMMYAPNVFTLNIQQMLSGAPIDSAIGVAVITIHQAHGLRNTDIGSGTPDPYVVLGINQSEKARTITIPSSANPQFNETKTLLLTTLNDPLSLEIFDYNEVRKDKSLGVAMFDLKQLEEVTEHEHVSETILSNGKPRGNINFSIAWYPVLTTPKLEDGSLGPSPESNAGIVRFTIHQAKNLGGGRNPNPYGILTMDSKEIARTPKMKHTNNPVWDFAKEILVHDKTKCVLGVNIKNDEFGGDQTLGAQAFKLVDLLKFTEDEVDDFSIQQSKDSTSKVKITATWKPIAGLGSSVGRAYVPPIGALRINFIKAVDLRNPEPGLVGGKADPYMRVMVNSRLQARTITIKNEQNPVWNEIVYLPVRTAKTKAILEVMDYQARTKDRSLGQIELDVGALITQDSDGAYLEYSEHSPRTSSFVGKDAKGTLQYSISFHPALNVMTLEEEEQADKERSEAAQLREPPSGVAPRSGSSDEGILNVSASIDARHARSMSTVTTTSSKRALAPPKVRLSLGDLSRYQSGFMVFEVLEAQLPQSNCYLQVLFDDHLFPAYTSSKAHNRHMKWNETGEGFIRELDVSRIVVRISKEASSGEEDLIIADSVEETFAALRRTFNQPAVYRLKSKDGQPCEITFRCHFIPVSIRLDPRESINNMGVLQVTVISAHSLCAADKGNKSDPYAKFYLDTQKEHIFKTETIKKTLNPTWNETFECAIASRIDNVFRVEVYDWDQIGNDDPLGTAMIPLASLQPMTSQTIDLPIDGPKGDQGRSGTIKLRLLFKPSFISRTRRGTTARASTIATGVIGAPIKGVGAGISGLKKTGTILGRVGGLRRSSQSVDTPEILPTRNGAVVVRDGNPDGTTHGAAHASNNIVNVAAPSEQRSDVQAGSFATLPNSVTSHGRETSNTSLAGSDCLLKLKVVSGTNFASDKKTLIKIRSKSGQSVGKVEAAKGANPPFNIDFTSPISNPDELEFILYEPHAFSSDKEIAEALVTVSPDVATGGAQKLEFANGSTLTIEMRIAQLDAASLKSHRGLKLNSPFRKSVRQL